MNKSERKRMLCVSLAAGAILLCGVLLVLLMRYQHTSTVRPQDQYLGQISDFYSTVDADGDGVDDQTDVLDNALAYVDTRPKYKSRYYQTGYPDDGYGVCTDVVAFALKNAGYDLQALVDADIREHPQWYDIQQPDANIDFRRVRNLKVFFSHTAVALTTEVSETEEWQGGDLVIFEKHIGIVSDRRNKNGVPYIIHHNAPGRRLTNRTFWRNVPTSWAITGSRNNTPKAAPPRCGCNVTGPFCDIIMEKKPKKIPIIPDRPSA